MHLLIRYVIQLFSKGDGVTAWQKLSLIIIIIITLLFSWKRLRQ